MGSAAVAQLSTISLQSARSSLLPVIWYALKHRKAVPNAPVYKVGSEALRPCRIHVACTTCSTQNSHHQSALLPLQATVPHPDINHTINQKRYSSNCIQNLNSGFCFCSSTPKPIQEKSGTIAPMAKLGCQLLSLALASSFDMQLTSA